MDYYRRLCFFGVFGVACLCLVPCLRAILIKNPGPVGGYTPFTGEGEKNTYYDEGTRSVTKFEWLKDGKPRLEVFVNYGGKTITLTWIQKRDDGTTQSQNEQVFSAKDGSLLSETKQNYDATGTKVVSGEKQGYDGWDEGKREVWVKTGWDPKSQEWIFEGYWGKPSLSEVERVKLKLVDVLKELRGETSPKTATGQRVGALPILMDKVKIDISGTGETIGHVATAACQNLTDQPVTFTFPGMILESKSGKNQHYACPNGQQVALKPNQKLNVPIDGVCLNRNKPPVGKGVTGDLVINTADPNVPQNPGSHIPASQARDLLRICTSKYEAADKLQKDGALKGLPYKDKQKQRDIVVQWSTWCDPRISEITGAPPATKDDLKKVIYKQVESKGKMSPETKKKVDQGIDTIFEKVELTTVKAKELEKPEEEIPAVAGTTVKETPSAGQPVSAPTETPGDTFARTPMATPQGPGTAPTEPTATPTPCKEDPLALAKAKELVDKAVKACRDFVRLDDEAATAEDAADAYDATPAGKDAKAKADKAAADAKDAKAAAGDAAEDAKAAADKLAKTTGKDKPAARDDARNKAKDAEDKKKEADAKAKEAEDAKSPLRKKADAARKKAREALDRKFDLRGQAKDAIKKLKCPENIDKLTKELEKDCGK